MHSLQDVSFLNSSLALPPFSHALMRSCLTSGGAADAVKIEITSDCVENGVTHVVSSRSRTACVLCLPLFILAGS